jgi:NADP-dependent 3-hydroxy acid dehydrogenase YdfG
MPGGNARRGGVPAPPPSFEDRHSTTRQGLAMTDKPLIAITGASSGIGEATAIAFSRAGYPLLLMARRLDRMAALNLPNAVLRQVDVRDREALKAAVADGEAEFGPVDLMFANAGVAHLADIATQPPEDWDAMIDINTKGVMNTVHAVMAGMIARRRGTLVMMSSIAGRKVYPDHTVYCGTKFFVHAVSESLREYLSAYDVRVQVISPGVIETEVLSGVKDAGTLAAYQANKAAIGGGIGPEHVADLILSTYQMPQNALVQEICITPTRQRY